MKPKPNTTVTGGLACAFGEPWLGPHPICRAHTAAACGVPIEDVPEPDFSHLRPIATRATSPRLSTQKTGGKGTRGRSRARREAALRAVMARIGAP